MAGPQILIAVKADGEQAVAEFKNVGDAAKYLQEQADKNTSAFEKMHAGLSHASEKLQDFGKKAFDAGKQMTVGLTLPIVAFGKQAVESYMEAEKSQTKLSDAFGRYKNLADTNIDAVNRIADATMRKTRFDDDAVRASYATLAQYGVTGKQINALIPLMTDYAAKTGKDLPAAADVLGKALLGKGKALAEVGLKFKDTKTLAGNYGEVMDGLSAKVRGFAEKDAATAEGRLEQLKNQFGELKEGIGAQLMPVLMALGNKVLGLLDGFNSLSPGLQKIAVIAAVVVAAAGPLVMIFGALSTAAGVLIGPVGAVVVAIAALAAGAIYAYTHFEGFRKVVDGVVTWFKAEVPVAFEWVKTKVTEAIDAMSRFWDRWGADIMRIASAMFEYLKNLFTGALTIIKGVWEVITGALSGHWGKVWDGIKDIARGAFDSLTAGIRAFGPLLLDAALWAFRKIKDGAVAGFKAVNDWAADLPDRIVGWVKGAGSWLLQAGKDVVAGFWHGIENGWKSFFVGGAGLGEKIKAKTNAELKRSSPSKEFFDIGMDVVAGLALGINAGEPMALDAISSITGSMAGEAARNGGKALMATLIGAMAGEAARNGHKAAQPLFAAMAGEAARNGTTVYTPLIAAMAGEAARNGNQVAKPLFAAMAGEAARNGADQIAGALRGRLEVQAKDLGYDLGKALADGVSEELTGSLDDIIQKMNDKIRSQYPGTLGTGSGASGSAGSSQSSFRSLPLGSQFAKVGGGDAAWWDSLFGNLNDWNNKVGNKDIQVRPFAPAVNGTQLTDSSGNPIYADETEKITDALSRLIPAMASGGIVSAPTLAMIGEAGPEAIVPLGGSRMAASPDITVNVAGSVIAERDLVDQIRKALIIAQQRGLTLVP